MDTEPIRNVLDRFDRWTFKIQEARLRNKEERRARIESRIKGLLDKAQLKKDRLIESVAERRERVLQRISFQEQKLARKAPHEVREARKLILEEKEMWKKEESSLCNEIIQIDKEMKLQFEKEEKMLREEESESIIIEKGEVESTLKAIIGDFIQTDRLRVSALKVLQELAENGHQIATQALHLFAIELEFRSEESLKAIEEFNSGQKGTSKFVELTSHMIKCYMEDIGEMDLSTPYELKLSELPSLQLQLPSLIQRAAFSLCISVPCSFPFSLPLPGFISFLHLTTSLSSLSLAMPISLPFKPPLESCLPPKGGSSSQFSSFLSKTCPISGMAIECPKRLFPCLHLFEKACVDQWLLNKDNCPVCRCRVVKD